MDDAHVGQQDDIHHQSIDNGRNSHDVVVEHKRTAGNGNGLGSILHANLNHDGTLLFMLQAHQPRQAHARQHRQQYQYGNGQTQLGKFLDDGFAVLNEEY